MASSRIWHLSMVLILTAVRKITAIPVNNNTYRFGKETAKKTNLRITTTHCSSLLNDPKTETISFQTTISVLNVNTHGNIWTDKDVSMWISFTQFETVDPSSVVQHSSSYNTIQSDSRCTATSVTDRLSSMALASTTSTSENSTVSFTLQPTIFSFNFYLSYRYYISVIIFTSTTST
ncbi:hypothetical protein B0J11DRAFT_163649 [Dendryphion nanum]|uniref:Uncharacterized protein n=1 Tax=Dendryphion nanum TaxID=256645 RepID=A0A9P9EFE7_9PLEO|nr:hypothetical protein B0J11DRAFT_163649 [Dendryphion nanum]